MGGPHFETPTAVQSRAAGAARLGIPSAPPRKNPLFPATSSQSRRLRTAALHALAETPQLRDRMLAGVRVTGVWTANPSA